MDNKTTDAIYPTFNQAASASWNAFPYWRPHSASEASSDTPSSRRPSLTWTRTLTSCWVRHHTVSLKHWSVVIWVSDFHEKRNNLLVSLLFLVPSTSWVPNRWTSEWIWYFIESGLSWLWVIPVCLYKEKESIIMYWSNEYHLWGNIITNFLKDLLQLWEHRL